MQCHFGYNFGQTYYALKSDGSVKKMKAQNSQ